MRKSPRAMIALILWLAATMGMSEAERPPGEVADPMTELTALLEERYRTRIDQVTLNTEKFAGLLKTIGESPQLLTPQPRERIARPELEKRLLDIAVDYSADPTRFAMLIEEYGQWRGDPQWRPHRPRPPELIDDHKTAECRHAWEALLLAPMTPEIGFLERRALEALVAIGNQDSLPILVEQFRLTCISGVSQSGPIRILRQRIAMHIEHFRNEAGLAALLRCVALLDEHGLGDLAPVGISPLRDKVYRYLVGAPGEIKTANERRSRERASQWWAVIKEFDRSHLPEASRAVLERAVAEWQRREHDEPHHEE